MDTQDNQEKSVKLRIRLGVSIEVPEQQALKIVRGDKAALLDTLTRREEKDGTWYLEGDSYIPEPTLENTPFAEYAKGGDIGFDFDKTGILTKPPAETERKLAELTFNDLYNRYIEVLDYSKDTKNFFNIGKVDFLRDIEGGLTGVNLLNSPFVISEAYKYEHKEDNPNYRKVETLISDIRDFYDGELFEQSVRFENAKESRAREESEDIFHSAGRVEYKPVYSQTWEKAFDNKETTVFWENVRLNEQCAADIDRAIRDNTERGDNAGIQYTNTAKAFEEAVKKHGAERVCLVAAMNVRRKNGDRRVSMKNISWASQLRADKTPIAYQPVLQTASILLDSFADGARKAYDTAKEALLCQNGRTNLTDISDYINQDFAGREINLTEVREGSEVCADKETPDKSLAADKGKEPLKNERRSIHDKLSNPPKPPEKSGETAKAAARKKNDIDL
jgi:hypothetical protein